VPAARPEIRDVLSRALATVAPGLLEMTETLRGAMPPRERPEIDPQDRGQFVHALVRLIEEALEGKTDEKRRFVLETAVPGLVAAGYTPVRLVESHVSLFTMLTHRLLEATPPEEREEAALWLAGYFAAHVHDVAAVAMAAESA